ncbi:DegV family protein [Bacillus aquiflavi]|uniref:DegV family protein n=1 Tax=Bacillus aquiflavi TaxID=2672567 RepID=UPI001CA9C099|nr:DegV family protein [Bacillus aquiflavi]UAC49056.1 DegV family protein [Bacillus aquiflavi]
MSVKILADSACDLPLDFLNKHQITLIPLKVHLDDREYEDLKTINPKLVYDAMRSGKAPKTSQASPQGFKDLFIEIAKEKQQAIYIAFSSELSGTYQTAVMIEQQVKDEYPDLDLTIINSNCASLGYGLVVKSAAELALSGASKDDILIDIHFNCKHMEHLFTVDNLEYLARGGRISKTSAFVGGLLNIKPLLNVEGGKLIPLEKIRGRKKVLRRILEIMNERGDNLGEQVIGISHGDDEKTAFEIKKAIEQQFGTKHFVINTIGAAIGSHSGPGTIAIFFF